MFIFVSFNAVKDNFDQPMSVRAIQKLFEVPFSGFSFALNSNSESYEISQISMFFGIYNITKLLGKPFNEEGQIILEEGNRIFLVNKQKNHFP